MTTLHDVHVHVDVQVCKCDIQEHVGSRWNSWSRHVHGSEEVAHNQK